MIGDVGKAKKLLLYQVGSQAMQNALAWMKGKEGSGATVDTIVKEITKRLFGNDYVKKLYDSGDIDKANEWLSDLKNSLNMVVEKLSTRPHTKRTGNFYRLVRGNVHSAILIPSDRLDPQDSQKRDKAYALLMRYLMLTDKPIQDENGESWVRGKYKSVNDKMGSILEVNKLKVLTVSSILGLSDQAKAVQTEMENARNATAAQRKKEEEEKARKEAEEKARKEAEEEEEEEEEKARKEAEEKARKAAEEEQKRLNQIAEGNITPGQFATLDEDIRQKLTKLVIPEGVQEIPENYFKNSQRLQTLFIPKSVNTIGGFAFEECTQLQSLTIESGVKTIGDYAFYGCKSLEKVFIPNSVEKIGKCAFWYCDKLVRLTISKGVKNIGSAVFLYCQKLDNVEIPESVESIGESAFAVCSELANLVIKDGVKVIGKSAFMGCKMKCVKIPDSLEEISEDLFRGCNYVEIIVIGKRVKTIRRGAFTSENIKEIDIPASVETIEEGAFRKQDKSWRDTRTVGDVNSIIIKGTASEDIKDIVCGQLGMNSNEE